VLALLPAPVLLPVLPEALLPVLPDVLLPVLPILPEEPMLLLDPAAPLVELPLGFEELAILSRTWCVA
jgi:hypothetical protein